jgi:hypothetical protein
MTSEELVGRALAMFQCRRRATYCTSIGPFHLDDDALACPALASGLERPLYHGAVPFGVDHVRPKSAGAVGGGRPEQLAGVCRSHGWWEAIGLLLGATVLVLREASTHRIVQGWRSQATTRDGRGTRWIATFLER